MIASLNEALGLLNLQPGEIYRTTVKGRELEVRALETAATEPVNEPEQFAHGEMMLEPWFTIPAPSLTSRS